MPTHPTSDTIRTIIDIHAMINRFIIEAVEDIPESRMTEQPGPIANHPAWTLSHLNAYSALLLEILDEPGAPPADAEMERFGYGTVPQPDPSLYASKPELIGRFSERGSRLAAVVAQKHDDYFPRPAPPKYQPYSPTIGHLAVTLLIAHPPHHLGQLRQWRRAAGFTEKS